MKHPLTTDSQSLESFPPQLVAPVESFPPELEVDLSTVNPDNYWHISLARARDRGRYTITATAEELIVALGRTRFCGGGGP